MYWAVSRKFEWRGFDTWIMQWPAEQEPSATRVYRRVSAGAAQGDGTHSVETLASARARAGMDWRWGMAGPGAGVA
jgi:hypothetical protein